MVNRHDYLNFRIWISEGSYGGERVWRRYGYRLWNRPLSKPLDEPNPCGRRYDELEMDLVQGHDEPKLAFLTLST